MWMCGWVSWALVFGCLCCSVLVSLRSRSIGARFAHSTSCTVTRAGGAPELIVSCSRLFCCWAGIFPVGEDSVFPVLCACVFSLSAPRFTSRPFTADSTGNSLFWEREFLFIPSFPGHCWIQVLSDMRTHFVVYLKMTCVISVPLVALNETVIYLF